MGWPNQNKYQDVTPGMWPANDEPWNRNNPEVLPQEIELPLIHEIVPGSDDHLYSDNGPMIRNGGRNERTPHR